MLGLLLLIRYNGRHFNINYYFRQKTKIMLHFDKNFGLFVKITRSNEKEVVKRIIVNNN